MNLSNIILNKPKAIQSSIMPAVLAKWDAAIVAKDEESTIGIYSEIGENWSGDGITAKKIAGILRAIGDKPVTVVINSPGGDVFEGIAIYNLLKEHTQKVTVKIVGIAASAASVIALAGDNVQIAKTAFFMIHNAWTVAVGNRHDMQEVADFLEPFDNAMAMAYADFSGLKLNQVVDLMDATSYISGLDAIELGFAHELLASDQIQHKEDVSSKALRADKIIDTLMAKEGITRSERRQLKKDYSSTPSAASDVMLNANFEVNELPEITFNF